MKNTRKLYILMFMTMMSCMLQAVTKSTFDFVVGVDGDFAAAKAAAEASTKSRFYIFFPDGAYDIGSLTGNENQMTTFNKSNVSFIGQSMDGVTVYNTAINEGISISATLYLNSNSSNIYLQDITFQNKASYVAGAAANRFVVIMDRGNKNIYKNVRMLSTQDTYYTPSGSNRSYLETCEIHGTVDFICGGGDLLFNKCLLYLEERSNNCITAPAGTGQWGYVFLDCTIDGYSINNNSYRLGRPWNNSPRSVFINTTMNMLPSAAGWGDPMNVVPALFAEYNSKDANGNSVDLSSRRTSYTKDGTTVTINPVLSASEASNYTIENVMKGTDSWRPDNSTKQISAPEISVSDNVISWNNNESALCYVIFKNGKYVANTTSTSYYIPETAATTDQYTVRAANEMGGLGESSKIVYPASSSSGLDVLVFYYDNGSVSSSRNDDYNNLWSCTDNDKTDYKWAITGREEKSILYGNAVTYKGTSYTTFKNSNGAQNTFYLPDNVKPKKVTFIGYTNDADNIATLSEVNGETLSSQITTNTSITDYAENPSAVSYTFSDDVCGQFTFTFSTKQVCFIMAMEVEESECSTVDIDETLVDAKELDLPVYDLFGRMVTKMEEGKIYIKNGVRFICRP